MGLLSKLFGGGAIPEVPFEAMALDEVQQRARRAEPVVAEVDPDQAWSTLAARRSADGTDHVVLGAVAACQICLGDHQQGVDTLNLAIFHDKSEQAIWEHTRMKATTLDLFLDQPEAAWEEYTMCSNIDAGRSELKMFLGEIALRRGQKRKLTRLLEEVLNAGLTGPLADVEAALHAEDHGAAVDALHVHHRISLLLAIKKALGTSLDTSSLLT